MKAMILATEFMNKQNPTSFLFFILAVIILAIVFYNYPQNMSLNYTGIVVAIICILGSSIMPKKK
jgi:membrane protein YdbS with pleckstrin-like domain